MKPTVIGVVMCTFFYVLPPIAYGEDDGYKSRSPKKDYQLSSEDLPKSEQASKNDSHITPHPKADPPPASGGSNKKGKVSDELHKKDSDVPLDRSFGSGGLTAPSH